MMTVKAKFDGRVFVPEQTIALAPNMEVTMDVSPVQEGKPKALERLAAIVEHHPGNPNAPYDGAAQVDHYLYGTAKRP